MRVAIDGRELCGHATGVGRFLSEILRAWNALPDARQHELIVCAPTPPTLPNVETLNLRVEIVPGDGVWWEQVTLRRALDRLGAQVLFAPGYSGPALGPTPLVVAIHDVSFAAHPEWFRWREGLRRRLTARAGAQRATTVITISQFSRREIHDHLGVPMDRIAVVYPGVGASSVAPRVPALDAPLPLRTQPDEPHVLYVGSIFNRRHVPDLIAGFGRLARRRPSCRLTIVGENRTFPPVDLARCRAASRAASRIELRAYVDDRELERLYASADAMAFLSEYEGFGLTPMEGLARGVPPLVLETPVAREIYGSAAWYAERATPAVVEERLEQLLFDSAVRATVLDAAPAVLARYDWTRCATTVLHALIQAGSVRAS